MYSASRLHISCSIRSKNNYYKLQNGTRHSGKQLSAFILSFVEGSRIHRSWILQFCSG